MEKLYTGIVTPFGINGGTSPAIDTTGANFIVAVWSYYTLNATTDHTISDSKSNTWNYLTQQTTTTQKLGIAYAYNATVGTSHTFTITGNINVPLLTILAFSGVKSSSDPFDQENGNASNSATSIQPGSITPSENNCLVIAGSAIMNASTVDSGFNLIWDYAYLPGNHVGCSHAYKIQTTAAAVNPTWSWSGSNEGAAAIASFKSDGSGPDPSTRVNLVAHTYASPDSGTWDTSTGWTTPAIDTTGATLIVIGSPFAKGTTTTISDSKSNTWNALTAYVSAGSKQVRLWYANNPTVGSGHTFSGAGVTLRGIGFVAAFSGTKQGSPFDAENGHAENGGQPTTIATGSVTPAGNNELFVACYCVSNQGGPVFENSGFQITDFSVNTSSNNALTGALAWKAQTTGAAENPVYTMATGAATGLEAVATLAAFEGSPAGGKGAGGGNGKGHKGGGGVSIIIPQGAYCLNIGNPGIDF